MELEELKTAWSELGRRLAEKDEQIVQLRRHGVLQGLRARLRLVSGGQALQLVTGALFALWGGSTWADHWGTWHLVAYGLGLHAYGLALLVTAAIQLARIAAIDYSGSVASIQQGIVRLKRARMRSEYLLLAVGGVGWVPILFLLAYYAGLDVWVSQPANVLANLGVGLAISLGLLWACVRYPAWLERTALGKHLADMEGDLEDVEMSDHAGAR